MQMIDKINCIPYGYNHQRKSHRKKTVEMQDAEPDEEEEGNPTGEMLGDEILRTIKKQWLDYFMKFDRWE